MNKKAAAAVNNEMLLRELKGVDSLGPEDDYVLGFLEGQRNAEFQRYIFATAIEGLIQIAISRNEPHSLSHARYILRNLGYDKNK